MFRIGEFSRLSRVSVRMLRHYDQLGLLKPSHTDSFTNYRYYSAEQLPRLNRILALRDLGFSLEQIGDMLDEELPSEQLLGMLRLKQAEIQQQMQIEQLRLARLEARIQQLNGKGIRQMYDVILREVEPQLVLSYREVAPDDDRIQYMFEEAEIYVAQFDARADKPPMTIYHDQEYREKDIDAEIVLPLKFAIDGRGEMRVAELPRIQTAACVVHTGDYATIYQAYNTLMEWIETNGYRMAGVVREVYLRYTADGLGFDLPPTYLAKDSNSFVTELQLPVEKI
ncbi:MAG TPA: MerR family transcriptional regulator [Anaerolineales bacterium]|nr:MerR family transcriptional regulator [Anaerolineales bacterium]